MEWVGVGGGVGRGKASDTLSGLVLEVREGFWGGARGGRGSWLFQGFFLSLGDSLWIVQECTLSNEKRGPLGDGEKSTFYEENVGGAHAIVTCLVN